MPTTNISINIASYNNGLAGSNCSSTNNPSQINFKWNRNISGIPSDNVLSQNKTIPVSSSSTLFDTSATYAGFTGVIAGTSTSVTLTASEAGTIGNSISLAFTGSNTITQTISAWNAANANNQLALTSGDGTQIPTVQNLSLSGAVGFVYSFFYFESDSAVTLLINGTISLELNPFVVNGTIFPAPFLINSDIQSVMVTNVSSANPADIFFTAVE